MFSKPEKEDIMKRVAYSLIVTSGGNPQYTNVYTRSKCGLAGIYDVEITDIVMAYGSGYEVYR